MPMTWGEKEDGDGRRAGQRGDVMLPTKSAGTCPRLPGG